MRIGIEFFLHSLMCIYLFLLYSPLDAVVYACFTISSTAFAMLLVYENFPDILSLKENPIINWIIDFIVLFALMHIVYMTEIFIKPLSIIFNKEIKAAEGFNEDMEFWGVDARMDTHSVEEIKSIAESVVATPFDLYPSLYILIFYGVTILVYLILSYLKKRVNKK